MFTIVLQFSSTCVNLLFFFVSMQLLSVRMTNILSKLGKPGSPVAAVERGQQVVVAKDIAMAVSDHNFTKSKIIPSVSLVSEIPSDISQSFYTGQVCVTLKEGIFEPSSCLRHCRELLDVLEGTRNHLKPILRLYTDGRSDH